MEPTEKDREKVQKEAEGLGCLKKLISDSSMTISENILKNNLDKNSLRNKIREKVNAELTLKLHNILPEICDEITDFLLNEITPGKEGENLDLIDYTLRFDRKYIESLLPEAIIFEGIASEDSSIFSTSRLVAAGELEVIDILPNYQALGNDRALRIETSKYKTVILFINSPGTNKIQRYLSLESDIKYDDYLEITEKITKHIIDYNGLKIN